MSYHLGVQLFWSWFYLLVLMIIWCAVKNWAMHSGLEIHNLKFNIAWPHLRRIDEYHMISLIHPTVFVQLALCTSALCIEKKYINSVSLWNQNIFYIIDIQDFFKFKARGLKRITVCCGTPKDDLWTWAPYPFKWQKQNYFLYRL